MRKFWLLFSVCGILLTSIIQAQESSSIELLMERFNENHMGSVLEVFTLEELEAIRNYLQSDKQNQRNNRLLERRLSASQVVIPVRVVSIDPDNLNDLHDFGASPLNEFEGAGFNRGNPINEAVIIDNTNMVYTRGIINNNYIPRGPVGGVPAGEVITGVEAVTGRTDIVYGVSTNGSTSSHLLRINQSNWQAETIGGNNGLVLPIALARDAANNLFTLDIDNDGVYMINRESGVVNFIGNVGYDANFGQGMAFDEATNQILSAAYNSAIGDSELREIDPNTGLSVSLGTINPGMLSQFGWISSYDEDTLGVPLINSSKIDVYPNPVSDILNIISSEMINSFKLFSITGQLVMFNETPTRNMEISLAHLPSGYFMLQIELEQSVYMRKILKY